MLASSGLATPRLRRAACVPLAATHAPEFRPRPRSSIGALQPHFDEAKDVSIHDTPGY